MADYNETFLGDLSDDFSNPTAHEFFPGELVLFAGSNVVTGTTNNNPLDRDFFTFEVPSGFTVSAIELLDYQWGDGNQEGVGNYGNSYFALTSGNAFSSISDDSTFLVSKLIDDRTTDGQVSEVGQDLLEPGVGLTGGNQPNPPGPGQLGPGTYTVWYQETGAPTTYSFDITLTAPAGANYGQIQFDPNSFSVDEAAGTFDITLTRTGGSDGNVGVVLRRFGGSATNLVDFNFRPVTAIFEQGETERTFTYSLTDDDLIEGDETAIFELVDPMGGVSIGSNNRATLTILDNDSPDVFKLEAEDLTLDTYLVESNEFASAGELASLRNASGINGSVSTTFAGNTDTYNVIVRYLDETDGTSTLEFNVNGNTVELWTLDKDLGTPDPLEQSFTERLIEGVQLQSGDLISIEGTKDRFENARIDSIQIVREDLFFQYEAEDMLLGTYRIENNEFASGDQLISLRNASGNAGTASTNFTGPTGTYDLTVSYLDESDGVSQLELMVDGAQVESWSLDKDFGSADPLEQTFIEREIRGVTLNNGSTITIMGQQDSFEWARVDFLRVIPSAEVI